MKKLIAFVIALSLIAGLSASTMAAPAKKKKAVKKPVKKIVKPIKRPVVRPMPSPVVTPTPAAPAPIAAAPAVTAGIGMCVGVNAGVSGGLTAIGGVLDYSTASILSGTKVRVGVDYLSGTNGKDSNLKIVTAKIGALYALDMLKSAAMPVDWYVEGAAAIPVKVSGAKSGSYGLEVAVGGNYMIPDFGTINAQVGYSALKYGGTSGAKGVLVSLGYAYSF
ncbi:MAG: hypothetical protein AABZ57_04465 [Candidatus Margulisiibacteriota bacterium]